MKAWASRRDWASMLLGAYLFLGPWIFGTAEDGASSWNARIAGICIIAAALWALAVPGSRAAGGIKIAIGGWLLTAPFVLGFAGLVAAWNAWIVGVLVISLVGVMRIIFALTALLQTQSLRYRAHRLSPEKIVGYRDSQESASPEQLSRQIVERLDWIYGVLIDKPSEVEVEMCALGYQACADDMITLAHLVDEDLAKSDSIRRMKLRIARRQATVSLSRARKALSPNVLHVPHRERP